MLKWYRHALGKGDNRS